MSKHGHDVAVLNGTGNGNWKLDMIHLSGPQVDSLKRLFFDFRLWVGVEISSISICIFGQARPGPLANMNDKWRGSFRIRFCRSVEIYPGVLPARTLFITVTPPPPLQLN